MGFTKKTWKNRIAEYINRRLITMEDGSTSLVTVARDEGTIAQEGDAFNAANMNDLEDRIESEFNEINQSLTLKNQIKIKTITKVITSSSGNINTSIPSTNNVLIARSAWDDNAAFIITPFASPQNQTWFLNCKDSSGNIYSNQPIGVIIYYY